MTAKRIFLTGASGCIGHYIAETLIQKTDHELFLLVRDPGKLKFDPEARPGVTILKADLRDIEQFRNILQTVEVAILAATAWGGSGAVFDINVVKTIRLMNLLNPAVCEQVLYFSTASILNRNNELLAEAGQMGTDYIRSKYDCFRQLPRLAIAPKITALYPTLVLGGDATHPYSHLSSGLAGVVKWINLIRFFKVDAGFHFIHAKDIAEVVRHLVENPPIAEIPGTVSEKSLRKKVLGVPAISVNQAVEEICAYLGKRIYFRIPLTLGLANFFIALFRVQMAPWDRFCLTYRHFTHQEPVTPSTYGLPTYCATFADVLRIHGVFPHNGRSSVGESRSREESAVVADEAPIVTTENLLPKATPSVVTDETPIVATENLLPKATPSVVGDETPIVATENLLPKATPSVVTDETPIVATENLLPKATPSVVADETPIVATDNLLPKTTPSDRGEEPLITTTDNLLSKETSLDTAEESSSEISDDFLSKEAPAERVEELPLIETDNFLSKATSSERIEERPIAEELTADSQQEHQEPHESENPEKPPSFAALEELPFLDPTLRQPAPSNGETSRPSEVVENAKQED